jgi:secreted PhoX family phosphatase
VTPWGTWLTCEETSNFVPNDASGVRHGYVFEVDPRGVSTNAVPYTAMGRFPHEACAVDPRNSDVYETEDAGITGLLYKFVPTDKSKRFGSLANGGSLFAMLVPGFTRFEQITTPGTVISGITWTPSPVDPDVGFGVNLRDLFPNTEVTRGQKLEGAWFADGVLWFVLSRFDVAPAAGQPDLRNNGQVFRYDPVKNQLELHVYIPVGGVFDQPDNIVVTPFGGAFLCEDGGGDQYVVGVDGQGATFPFAKNRVAGNNEFAGACFSPDARFMFVNIQNPSTTFAITGPWALNADLPPVVPEVPKAVMLPLAGVGALAAGVLALRRRGEGGSAQA